MLCLTDRNNHFLKIVRNTSWAELSTTIGSMPCGFAIMTDNLLFRGTSQNAI